MKYVLIGNSQEWCYYSWLDYVEKNSGNIRFYNSVIPIGHSVFLTKLCYRFFLKRTNDFVLRLFPKLWYWLIYKSLDLKNTQYFLIYDWSQYTKDLLLYSYIKKKNPNITLIYLFSNIVNISGAKINGILNSLNDYYDQIYAFDKIDAVKYGFKFNNLIYCGNKLGEQRSYKYDVFYVGNAKDRLDELHGIYKKLRQANLKCKFFIVGVPENKQKYENEIVYNQTISYAEALKYISESRCLVDVIQGGSTAMTIKVCEAVIYDKKLITSNAYILSEPYYNPNNILVYGETDADEIRKFIEMPYVPYKMEEKNIFSPDELLRRINNK